jgi:hypothetical protein
VGLGGIEPPTSALSVLRSNRLSYSPGVELPIVHDAPKRPLARHRSTSPRNVAYLTSSTT